MKRGLPPGGLHGAADGDDDASEDEDEAEAEGGDDEGVDRLPDEPDAPENVRMGTTEDGDKIEIYRFDTVAETRFHALLGTIESNTNPPGKPMRAGITRSGLNGLLASKGRYTVEGVGNSIEQARFVGEIFEWQDGAHTRYSRQTEDGIRAVIAEQNARDPEERDLDLIRRCGRLLDALPDDAGDADADAGD